MIADGPNDHDSGPLAGLTILDLLDAPFTTVTRIYAQLGAKVVRIETDANTIAPNDRREALERIVADIHKERLAIQLGSPDGQDRLVELARHADMIVASPPKDEGMTGLQTTLRAASRPGSVWMTVSMFGTSNSYTEWQATDPVLNALSSVLSRSGLEGREPILPPGKLALSCGMAQAAYVGMAALYASQVTHHGDNIDFSMLDGVVQALDPGFGLAGSATLGRSARNLAPGRPKPGTLYPIFPCADGTVRLCVLAPRQWQNMHRWLGEPKAFAGPEFNKLEVRQQSVELTRHLSEFFAARSVTELEREGAQQGVPVSGVLSLNDCLESEHVRQTGILQDVIMPEGGIIRVPRCPISVEKDAGGEPPMQHGREAPPPSAQPLRGLKVLDLGVIVVGGEQSRLLADLGADVVKIESAAFPDGTRQSYLPTGLSVGFAAGHRNKRSLGLDLRHPEGKALFLRLAREADVILSNFKPGTMSALGFSSDEIQRINSGVVMVESSAFGPDGPWSSRMGYGPLVRAASGLTSKWRYRDDPLGYSDTVTIYPDHAAARYGTVAVLALLFRRLQTRRGGTATISQMEVILDHFTAEIAGQQAGITDWDAPVDAPWGVFPTRGQDEWCVITVRDDLDWKALTKTLERNDWALSPAYQDRQGRLSHKSEIERGVTEWLAQRDADAAMRTLQAAGIPAARMMRIADLPEFEYFKERGLFRAEHHPHLAEEIIAERFHAFSANVGSLPSKPAPLLGEHSIEVLQDWLGLTGEDIGTLIEQGVIQEVNARIQAMLAQGEGRGEAFAA